MINYKKPIIFIVEDEPAYSKLIEKTLNVVGFRRVIICNSGEECLKKLEEIMPDIVFQDFDLPGMNGMEVMLKVKEKHPGTEFIFLSGQSSIKVAVETLKKGAFDYIIKDEVAQQNVVQKIRKVLLISKLTHEKESLRLGKRIFLIILLITWLTIGLLTYFGVFKHIAL